MGDQLAYIEPDTTLGRILDASEELFAEHGYEGTTLRLIAQKVGIKEPSIYAHFTNKEAVYAAVIDVALKPFNAELAQWVGKQMSLRDLLDIPRKLLALHARHPNAARIMHREFCLPAERINPQVMAWLIQIAGYSRLFMAELLGREEPLAQEKVVTYIITLTNITLGFFSTQGMQRQLMGEQFCPEQMFEEYVAILTKIFRGVLL